MTTTMLPREGMLVPAFELPRSDGGSLRLRSYRGRRSLGIFFAHRPDCDACRAYLAAALDRYDAYAAEGAEVIAVVPGEAEAVARLRRELALPFPLVVDTTGTVFARYGLIAERDAAALVADRYGEPRLWQLAGPDHTLPRHSDLIAELRYLALTCAGGCSSG